MRIARFISMLLLAFVLTGTGAAFAQTGTDGTGGTDATTATPGAPLTGAGDGELMLATVVGAVAAGLAGLAYLASARRRA